jgi:hypothetical protein
MRDSILLGVAGLLIAGAFAWWMAACGTVGCEEDRTCPYTMVIQSDAGNDLMSATMISGAMDGAMDRNTTLPDGAAADRAIPVDGGTFGDANNDSVVDPAEASDGPPCDMAQEPNQSPCLVSDGYGVFVATSGNDSNSGTHDNPVKSIGHALDLAKQANKRVYICAGTYAEKVVVDVAHDGAGVYGGFDCTNWSYSAGNHVIVAPKQPGYALELDSLQTGATFEDIEFDAADSTSSFAGGSSIVVFANASSQVVFRRVTLAAGNGSQGSVGATGGSRVSPSNHYGQSLDGATATNVNGAAGATCMCPDGKSSSGGGNGGGIGAGQTPGTGTPSYGSPKAGAPGINSVACTSGGNGQNGADAPAGTAVSGSMAWGAISSMGWMPAAGTNGSNGAPGQGGGGGGNGLGSAGGGGSGACGGCGGTGGNAGTGGGSSIALLSFQSAVTLVQCTLTAHNGGKGGTGGSGELGQLGGSAGSGTTGGCVGGAGGASAGGNGAQGGPGGLSLGVAYSGNQPTIDGNVTAQAMTLMNVNVGTPGTGGIGGNAGAAASSTAGQPGAPGPKGLDGVAAAVMSF